jgi:hypothetical protein
MIANRIQQEAFGTLDRATLKLLDRFMRLLIDELLAQPVAGLAVDLAERNPLRGCARGRYPPGPIARSTIPFWCVAQRLSTTAYDCVVIGAGVRLPPKSLLLFEAIVNAVHKAAPNTSIAFNTVPEDSADAASVLRPGFETPG